MFRTVRPPYYTEFYERTYLNKNVNIKGNINEKNANYFIKVIKKQTKIRTFIIRQSNVLLKCVNATCCTRFVIG